MIHSDDNITNKKAIKDIQIKFKNLVNTFGKHVKSLYIYMNKIFLNYVFFFVIFLFIHY